MIRILIKYKFIRYFYVLLRLLILVYFFKRLQSIKETGKSIKCTTERNQKSLLSLRDCYDGSRSDFFLKKFKKIETLDKINKIKVLLVGPRNEGEIYNFYSKGFLMKNITAIDLISYSKKIIKIDADIYLKKCKKKYDLIYFGFVINYFRDPKKILFLAEKCLNNNGYLIVCAELSRKIKDSRKMEKTIKFKSLKSTKKIFPRNLINFYETEYKEKLYYFNSVAINCFITIKKKSNYVLLSSSKSKDKLKAN
jgi:hypothetical protein